MFKNIMYVFYYRFAFKLCFIRVVMTLSKKLWGFWDGLNKGEINWAFIYDNKTIPGDRDKAFQVLVDRKFIVDRAEVGRSQEFLRGWTWLKTNCWVVRSKKGKILNPGKDEETFYFKDKKYARQYINYLLGFEQSYKNEGLEIKEIDGTFSL